MQKVSNNCDERRRRKKKKRHGAQSRTRLAHPVCMCRRRRVWLFIGALQLAEVYRFHFSSLCPPFSVFSRLRAFDLSALVATFGGMKREKSRLITDNTSHTQVASGQVKSIKICPVFVLIFNSKLAIRNDDDEREGCRISRLGC